MKKSFLTLTVILISIFMLSGCGAKVAPDLLAKVKVNNEPLVENSSAINVTINPDINNYEELDKTVKESLDIALTNGNLFGTDSSNPYKIDANILIASQSPFSFGSFEGTLEVQYVVHDSNNVKILDKKIFTIAGSDRWSFIGAKRHRRARAVNISKNVLQFIDILQNTIEENNEK
jgi:hypothetical protein